MSDVSNKNNGSENSIINISDLKQNKAFRFDERWPDEMIKNHIDTLGLRSLKKVSIVGQVAAEGRKNWTFNATVGASAVQTCVVSGDDVKTRLDVKIVRRYLSNYDEHEAENTSEEELDAEVEPIPDQIDLLAMAFETIMLSLDEYPRLPGMALETTLAAPKGVEPLTDEAIKPFAALAGLKDKLKS